MRYLFAYGYGVRNVVEVTAVNQVTAAQVVQDYVREVYDNDPDAYRTIRSLGPGAEWTVTAGEAEGRHGAAVVGTPDDSYPGSYDSP